MNRRNRPTSRRWKLPKLSLAIGAVALAGLGLFLYPVAADWFYQLNASKESAVYVDSVRTDAGEPTNAERLAAARAYNAALNAGAIAGPWETSPGDSTDAAMDYWQLLKRPESEIMARIQVPSVGIDLPVFHGTSDEVLEKGVGHLHGTSLPVGGEGTRSVLSAHRGLASAELFTNLDKVKIGDRITLSVLGDVLVYDVVEIQVVEPDETEKLRPEAGRDLLTLTTCTPLGINTQRILLTAERVELTEDEAREAALEATSPPGFPWWAAGMGGGTLFAGLYVWRTGYPPRARPGRSIEHVEGAI